MTAATVDPNLANNSATVTSLSAAEADVSVTKTVAAGPVLAGNTVAYTITVSNAGPSDSQTVALSDVVPADTTFVSDAQLSGPAFTLTNPAVGGTGTISGTIGTLASGASASFSVVVLVSPSAPAGTTIANTATVTAATADPNLANNTSTVTSLSAAEADVSVTKTTAAGPAIAGSTVAYTITVSNAGPSDSQTVALSDVVPANTTFVSDAQLSGPAFTLTNPAVGGTGTISGTIATLASGGIGKLHRGGAGVPQCAGWNDDRQHGDSDCRHSRPEPRQQQFDGNESQLNAGRRIGDEDGRGRPGTGGQHDCLHDHGVERRPERLADRGGCPT